MVHRHLHLLIISLPMNNHQHLSDLKSNLSCPSLSYFPIISSELKPFEAKLGCPHSSL